MSEMQLSLIPKRSVLRPGSCGTPLRVKPQRSGHRFIECRASNFNQKSALYCVQWENHICWDVLEGRILHEPSPRKKRPIGGAVRQMWKRTEERGDKYPFSPKPSRRGSAEAKCQASCPGLQQAHIVMAITMLHTRALFQYKKKQQQQQQQKIKKNKCAPNRFDLNCTTVYPKAALQCESLPFSQLKEVTTSCLLSPVFPCCMPNPNSPSWKDTRTTLLSESCGFRQFPFRGTGADSCMLEEYMADARAWNW